MTDDYRERAIRAVQEIWAYHVYLKLPSVQLRYYHRGRPKARCAISCLLNDDEMRYLKEHDLATETVDHLLNREPHMQHLPSLRHLDKYLLREIQRGFDHDKDGFCYSLFNLCDEYNIPYPGGKPPWP